MSLFPSIVDFSRAHGSKRPRAASGAAPGPCSMGVVLACALVAGSCLNAWRASAQSLPSSTTDDVFSSQSSQLNPQNSDNDNPAALASGSDPLQQVGGATGPGGLGTSASLSADQITRILEQNPDLVVELKSELADRMQQQGVEVDPDSISDEKLYSEIATNPSLRKNITTVLRARGYVSADDIASTSEVSSGAPGAMASKSSQSGLSTADDSADGAVAKLRGSDSAVASAPSRHVESNASTDAPKVVRRQAPYDLPSMRDLYAQLPAEPPALQRFGSEVFLRRDRARMATGSSPRNTPLDVPLGPDYVIGPGDTLSIDLWGSLTQKITRSVGRDGRILVPEAGSLQVAGLPLGKAEELITAQLQRQYRDAHVAVTVTNLRSVRVYIVGDVQRPGGYDISALATPVSALYSAGGPTAVGSLRTLLHYRAKQLVEKIDLYDFLLHGTRTGSAPFESGDTLLVPPAGPQVAVLGAVKRPAIYELREGETTLSTVIEDAGGLTAAAALNHIRIERIDANRQRVTVTLPAENSDVQADRAAIERFGVQDGDRIHIEPILPYSQRAVYLAGHVVRPGRLPYTDGMRVSDVLRSYRDMLPEPADRGEIVRLVPPDLHAEAIEFSVPDVLIGNANVDLRPFDTIRISGRYEADEPMVTIHGEVLRPGRYPMSHGMTTAQLVRMAGGLKRDALVESADLASYRVEGRDRIVENITAVKIGAALSGNDPDADVVLKPGDILSIHQISNWENIGESVSIDGQVRFPGSYGFTDGERLSSVLRRAGGLLPTAYPQGAVLIRSQVRDLELQSRDEMVRQIEANSAAARLSPAVAGQSGGTALQLIKAQQEQVLTQLKNHPPSGRMVIHITADIDSWANTPADIELRRGDTLMIPKRPGFVLVTGQVYNATALAFTPDKTAKWYLSRAGGANAAADSGEIFIVRVNGSVVGRRSSGWFGGDVLSTKLNPGDVVVVPQKIIGGSLFWRNLMSAGQLAASVAITAGVAAAAL
jgi:protein involved in polysaccharide export with SLBB domain